MSKWSSTNNFQLKQAICISRFIWRNVRINSTANDEYPIGLEWDSPKHEPVDYLCALCWIWFIKSKQKLQTIWPKCIERLRRRILPIDWEISIVIFLEKMEIAQSVELIQPIYRPWQPDIYLHSTEQRSVRVYVEHRKKKKKIFHFNIRSDCSHSRAAIRFVLYDVTLCWHLVCWKKRQAHLLLFVSIVYTYKSRSNKHRSTQCTTDEISRQKKREAKK